MSFPVLTLERLLQPPGTASQTLANTVQRPVGQLQLAEHLPARQFAIQHGAVILAELLTVPAQGQQALAGGAETRQIKPVRRRKPGGEKALPLLAAVNRDLLGDLHMLAERRWRQQGSRRQRSTHAQQGAGAEARAGQHYRGSAPQPHALRQSSTNVLRWRLLSFTKGLLVSQA